MRILLVVLIKLKRLENLEILTMPRYVLDERLFDDNLKDMMARVDALLQERFALMVGIE